MTESSHSALTGIGVLARCLPHGAQGDIHLLHDAAVGWKDGRIAWVGPEVDLPMPFRGARAIDAAGALVTPALIDCHTHLAFGGWRADEFVGRIEGETYLEIAARGGGIKKTVSQTRSLSKTDLVTRCAGFLKEMLALGITTVEAKSGYGLDLETEVRQLEAYETLAQYEIARIVPTVLAHAVPNEYQGHRAAYVEWFCEVLLPVVAERSLAKFADVFVEQSAFTLEEGRQILLRARELGLGLKIHAEQITDSGAAAMAASLGATSADHLEKISADGVSAMALSGAVAVSLPLATAYLNADPLPARDLMEAGVPVAVATDFNPGSAPSYHLPFAMTLACLLQRMTPSEVLKGATTVAAGAVGLENEIGSVAPGMAADLLVVDAESVDQWLYHLKPNAVRTVIRGGHVVAT